LANKQPKLIEMIVGEIQSQNKEKIDQLYIDLNNNEKLKREENEKHRLLSDTAETFNNKVEFIYMYRLLI
jgi:hypothetical protein